MLTVRAVGDMVGGVGECREYTGFLWIFAYSRWLFGFVGEASGGWIAVGASFCPDPIGADVVGLLYKAYNGV